MSTHPSAAAGPSEPRSVHERKPSRQEPREGADDVAPMLSRRTPRSKAKRRSRVGVEFTNTVSRPSCLSLVAEDPGLHQEEQERNEKRMRNRIFAVQELIESERQYSRTLQFMINVAIPLAQGYAPQPIGDVATKKPYLPQGNIDPVGPPVLSGDDINLVFGPGPYKLYQGSCHITDILGKEITKKGFERARVGKFLVFAIPFMEREFCPYIARYRLANERWVALDDLKTPEMRRYKEAVAEQARAWSQAGYVVIELAATWSNIGGLIAQSWYRWTKYALLVEAILAHTRKSDPDYQMLDEAKQMLKSANARINELGGRWTVIGALLSGKGIEGAVATRSNIGVKLVKTPLMMRLFKKGEIKNDPGQELEDHLRCLKTLDSDTVNLIDNTRAWIDAAAECMDSALLSTIQFANSVHGHRDRRWEEVALAMTGDFEMSRSKLETTFEDDIFPNIEKLRHSMNGPSTVLDAAFKMQRHYITGMDHGAEGAKNVFETYAEICTQLGDDIPKYMQVYLKGMTMVVLRLSTAQAEYYDDISKVFEMVFKEKGLKGDRESYRRDRPNGGAPKLRAASVYQAIAEDRLPGSKELRYGSYGCNEGHTRQIWEEAAGEYLSRLGAGAATFEDRLKEYREWRKNHRGESTSNSSVSSLSSRLASRCNGSIENRSTPTLTEIGARPILTPPGTPPGVGINIRQRSRQISAEPIGTTLQRSMTAPSTIGSSRSPPTRAKFTPISHHRSRSHGYPLTINKSLPAIPSPSAGLVTGTAASPPAVPPRPPGGHRRQCSEDQVVMESPKWYNGQPAVPFNNPVALGNQPSTSRSHRPVWAEPVTVVAIVARPVTNQIVKSNFTQKLQDHHQVSSSMQLANRPSPIASQCSPRAKQGRSKSQSRACPQPSRFWGSSAPRDNRNQASTSNLDPSNATIEPSPPAHPPPPQTSPTCLSMPLSKSVPSSSEMRNNYTTITVRKTEDSLLLSKHSSPIVGFHPVLRRDACIPGGGKAEKCEGHSKNNSA